MKKQAATLLILVAMVALPGLVSAQVRKVIKADVPFDFIANGKSMPAGECTIQVRGEGQSMLLISSGKEHLFVSPNSAETLNPSEKTVLVFHRYGDRYFLSGISREGETSGYELPASRVEKELRAQKAPEGDVTLLASSK